MVVAVLRTCAWGLLLTLSGVVACSQATTEDEDAGAAADPLAACAALGGDAPQSIADAVARIDALPSSSIPCFVASLPRPLSLAASVSPVSAQPSTALDNPRVFILYDSLTLSVVPGGEGRELLEFGERVTPVRSLKAELHFPVERPVSAEKPYERLVAPGQSFSLCGSCHRDEEPHPTIPGAFISNALRPARYADLELAGLSALRAACDEPGGERLECELLRALFDYGEVRQGAFEPAIERGF